MTEEEFTQKVGRAPVADDLERVNCSRAGEFMHWFCGWCEECDKPNFMCANHKQHNKSLQNLMKDGSHDRFV